MASSVSIANIALVSYLGTQRINSLADGGPIAPFVSELFDDTRREILSEWPWSFATRRRPLVLMADNDRPEWRFKYARPSDAIRLNWVNDPETAKQAIIDRLIDDSPRDVVEGFIYSDLPSAVVEYVYDNEDATTYSPKFVQAFAALLATKLAVPLTEVSNKAQNAMQAYVELLDEAKVFDVRSEPPVRVSVKMNWGNVEGEGY